MATAAAANESRQDLLNWINDLLQMNVSKIEQIGTGAILCQIFDSIYGNVALHKVKFNTHQEFEYIQNFKILQAAFTQNRVDKYIPVDRLIKLKFQENLEFLQWVKKFWDANFPGGAYDAIGRRGGKSVGGPTDASRIGRSTAPQRMAPASMVAAARPVQQQPVRTTVPPSSQSQAQNQNALKLQKEIAELRLTVDEVEKERNFYFGKLRDIEVEIQKIVDANGGNPASCPAFVQTISAILYKTEEGFETPEADMTA